MGLGQGFSGLRPRANETAATLLTPKKVEHGKDVTLQLRIKEDKLLLFKEICEKRGGKMSAALRNYINNVIATDGVILSFKE